MQGETVALGTHEGVYTTDEEKAEKRSQFNIKKSFTSKYVKSALWADVGLGNPLAPQSRGEGFFPEEQLQRRL